MTTPPRRRWFRFSLRTFFVVVAIVIAWLAWQVSIVRERKAVRDWLEGKIAESNSLMDRYNSAYKFSSEEGYDPDKRPSLPPLSWSVRGMQEATGWQSWLDDDYVPSWIYYPAAATSAEIARVRSAFPEATVEPWPDGWDGSL